MISDINMPNMNGFEMLEIMKGLGSLRHIPVLMVTAEARSEDITRAATDGASIIIKPYTTAALKSVMEKIFLT